MGKNISTMYTKEKNNNCGRKGYVRFKEEKETDIPPKNYGMFIQQRNKKHNYK